MKSELIEKILEIEWEMFYATPNEGGQASCQRNKASFDIMRRAQFTFWDEESLGLYLDDLRGAEARGENLPTLKYAYMMESTCPEGYEHIAHLLPKVEGEKNEIVESLVAQTLVWCEDFAGRWPNISARGRSIRSETDSVNNTSVETYSRGELSSYGLETLRSLRRHYASLAEQGINLHEKVVEAELLAQGAASLAEAEKMLGQP